MVGVKERLADFYTGFIVRTLFVTYISSNNAISSGDNSDWYPQLGRTTQNG